jgi:hypothetical protein
MTAICILFFKNHTVDLVDDDHNHRLLTAPIQAINPSVISIEDPATCKAVIQTSPRISKRKYGPAFILFVGLSRYAAILLDHSAMKPTVEDVVRILMLYAKSREMLFQIEMDLGIVEMTEKERKVLAVLARLSGGTNCDVQLDEIRQDAIITDIPAPSLYRAFSTLQKQGYIGRSGGQRSGLYHLSERALD